MKLLPTFILLIFLSHQTHAQNWSLFPHGQKTYWESAGEFHLYYNDSIKTNGDLNTHYFGINYLTEAKETACYDMLMQNQFQVDQPPIDSIYSAGNYWYGNAGSDTMNFYHLTEPGDGWTNISPNIFGVDSIVFSCQSKTQETFFGITDSVKTFTLQGYNFGNAINKYNGVEYKLSKAHGLLKYFPFHTLNEQPVLYEMIGYDDGQGHGFTHSWENYFGEFQVSQIMKWWEIATGMNTPPGYSIEESFYIDSILEVSFSDSLVSLNVDRYGTRYYWKQDSPHSGPWDSIATFTENKNIVHLRDHYQLTLDSPPGWFHIDRENGGVSYQTQHNFSNWGLPTVAYDDFDYSYFPADNSCDGLIADPQYIDEVLTRGLGLTNQGIIGGFWYLIHNETKLLGYGLNGEYFGDVINPVFSTPKPNLNLAVYPNPASDYLQIELDKNIWPINFELIITDVSGKIILRKKMNDNIDKINISNAPTGIYFISIKSENVFGREKFIKY